MNINDSNNIVKKLSHVNDNSLTNLDLTLFLVRKQNHSDNYFTSSEVVVNPEVTKWLKERIIDSLNELKEIDDNGEKRFVISEYNHEVERTDYLARYNLAVDPDLLQKKNKLLASINEPQGEYTDKNTNFQIVELKMDEESVYFCFYRGTKKNTKRKKMAIKNSNEFNFFEETIIDVGGNIDFFFVKDQIFIINNTAFEHAFNYRDHINQKRDRVIADIVSMPFFDSETSNGHLFTLECKKYIYSRSLAQISDDTLESLQRNFEDRCDELKKIKNRLPEETEEQNLYIKKLGTIWLLIDYIDTENYKIVFSAGDKPTPLIHFFADKIVKSFLTDDIKLALAYE